MKSSERLTEIEKKIANLQKEAGTLREEVNHEVVELAREQYGVQVVCLGCAGTGVQERGGADIISDPPYEDDCEDCEGNGFRWAMRWRGVKGDYSGVLEEMRVA